MEDHPLTLGQLTRPQFEAIIKKATIKGEGTYQDPPLDLDAIRSRAEALDAKDPIKADVFLLLKAVMRS